MSQIDDVFAGIIRDVATSLERTGLDAVEDLKEHLSTPVEHLPDGTIIRSGPDEDPRMEFDKLRQGSESFIEFDATSATLQVMSSRSETPDVPMILEYGEGPIAARGYMLRQFNRTVDVALPNLVADLSK